MLLLKQKMNSPCILPFQLSLHRSDKYARWNLLQFDSDGTIYVEQLKSFDFSRRKWEYIEQLPPDLLDEVRQKIKLVVS